jgi:hypothetical protein
MATKEQQEIWDTAFARAQEVIDQSWLDAGYPPVKKTKSANYKNSIAVALLNMALRKHIRVVNSLNAEITLLNRRLALIGYKRKKEEGLRTRAQNLKKAL